MRGGSSKISVSNHVIVVVAAYLAGAASKRIDTEDIAFTANQIAPGRFAWRKYRDQINIDAVRKRLWDACKEEKGGYLNGSEKEGWLLTPAGTKSAREWIKLLPETLPSKERKSVRERSWQTAERRRLVSTEAFCKFSDQKENVSLRDAESFFRVDNYITGSAREAKVLRIVNAFGDDEEIGTAVHYFAGIVRRGSPL